MPKDINRQLSRRVQEFELWKDDKDLFKDAEYARRRAERRRDLKQLESDRRLKCWKKVYVPSLLAILGSSVSLLCSSIPALGEKSFFFAYKDIFHIVAPIVLIAGIIGLMIAAACSYREEERLRIELGLPSQFPQAQSFSSTKSETRSAANPETDEAIKKKKKKKKKKWFWRKESAGSVEISNFLELSSSSATTEMTWLQHSCSSTRPITLEVAEAHVFEECEEEDFFERVVDTHTTMCTRQLIKIHPQTSKPVCESTDCVMSENSSGYSTVAGSEPDNAATEPNRNAVVDIPGPDPAVATETEDQYDSVDQR